MTGKIAQGLLGPARIGRTGRYSQKGLAVPHHARITDGSPAPLNACCDVVHFDAEGNLTDRPAMVRLVLTTSIGRRFVDLCDAHETAVGSDLARWSHPIEAAQSEVEGGIDGMLTVVLSESF